MCRGFAGCIFAGLLLLLGQTSARAQGETTSAIVGQVADATGAAIPDAAVTITSRQTGLRRSVRADKEGRFNFPQLTPGAYSVRVEAESFEPQPDDDVFAGLGSGSGGTVEVTGHHHGFCPLCCRSGQK